jgi:2,4-dienoyl-CoA reductase (NADPH2)
MTKTMTEPGTGPKAETAVDPIFQPLHFRSLTVKNRIFRSNISGIFDNQDGSLTQTRINWESKFAAGGVGAIISSYVPVLMEGRIIASYATVHRDEFIPLWHKIGEAVHSLGARYIMQLSHSGRQMDLPGVHNQHRRSLSSTRNKETLHGFLYRAITKGDIERTIAAFADGAWRAREAGLDGVELHAANGYLFTQFLSSGINDRKGEYGGTLANRTRFLLEVIGAIRARRLGFSPSGEAERSRPQQCHALGKEGQRARRHGEGRAMGRGGGCRCAACLVRLAVPASAQSARRPADRDPRRHL